MLDILLNLDHHILLVATMLYLMLCQLIAKRKGFLYWYIEGVVWGLSVPLIIIGLGLGVYEFMGVCY